jgi:ABC-type multidrug transport system ATPase subunit
MATGGQGDVFECARISLSVPAKGGGRKHLLTGVNFSASAGELVCCIGPSGAGKTMLLNALTFSVQGEMRKSNRPRVSGAITFAGRSIRNLKEFRRVCSFVPNHNLQFPTLTVKEILTFGAQMSSSDPPVVIKDRVNKIIKLLGLEGCQDTIAGGYVGLKGISGGQLKRLCIGQGLLTAPRVLFLDEPTRWVQQFYLLLYTTANLLHCLHVQWPRLRRCSPYNGASALCCEPKFAGRLNTTCLQQHLKDVAQKSNTVVVATLQQPSQTIFEMAAKVLLLSKGQAAYFGSPRLMQQYFDQNCGLKCPARTNPADFALSVVTSDFTNADDSAVAQVLKAWTVGGVQTMQILEGTASCKQEFEKDFDVVFCRGQGSRPPKFYTQCSAVLRRDIRVMISDPLLYLARIISFWFM